jgi:hypothetical protein
MSEANDLIERAEREAGCRWDDPNNNNAMAILFGAVARVTGKSKFGERDDMAVGHLILDDIANGDARRKQNEMLAELLTAGIDPDFFLDSKRHE